MNHKEALEAIAYGIHLTDDIEGHLRDLATQALTPQECDTTKDINIRHQILDYAMQLYLKGAPIEKLLDRMFNEISELRIKLNLKQKTFTLEEVRGIIKEYSKNVGQKWMWNNLLKEFEKAKCLDRISKKH